HFRLTLYQHVLSIEGPRRCPMNPVERVLDDELARLLDRLAASVPGGSLGAVSAMFPGLRARIDQVEAGLAILRGTVLESYGQWRRGLEDLENIWALAAWRAAAAEGSPEGTARLAAGRILMVGSGRDPARGDILRSVGFTNLVEALPVVRKLPSQPHLSHHGRIRAGPRRALLDALLLRLREPSEQLSLEPRDKRLDTHPEFLSVGLAVGGWLGAPPGPTGPR